MAGRTLALGKFALHEGPLMIAPLILGPQSAGGRTALGNTSLTGGVMNTTLCVLRRAWPFVLALLASALLAGPAAAERGRCSPSKVKRSNGLRCRKRTPTKLKDASCHQTTKSPAANCGSKRKTGLRVTPRSTLKK